MKDLKELKHRIESLCVFNKLKEDTVISALLVYAENPCVLSYTGFLSALYETGGADLGDYIKSVCESCENVYLHLLGAGKTPPKPMRASVERELEILQGIAQLRSADLQEALDYDGKLPEFYTTPVELARDFWIRAERIGQMGYGIYAKYSAFYLDEQNKIVPVKHPDKIELSSFVDYEAERKRVFDNTRALVSGKPAANVLLTGDAGCGKSSTIKAIARALFDEGVRIIEVRKDQLYTLHTLLDELAENPLKFILFIDDLSFAKNDDNFSALKAVLEGSVSARSKNVVIYATSNRRHILKERFSDREGDDVHRNDTMQEVLSLSERFGIHISFYAPSKQTYLHIVECLADAAGITADPVLAERYALERGGRSARLAKQFVDMLISQK